MIGQRKLNATALDRHNSSISSVKQSFEELLLTKDQEITTAKEELSSTLTKLSEVHFLYFLPVSFDLTKLLRPAGRLSEKCSP